MGAIISSGEGTLWRLMYRLHVMDDDANDPCLCNDQRWGNLIPFWQPSDLSSPFILALWLTDDVEPGQPGNFVYEIWFNIMSIVAILASVTSANREQGSGAMCWLGLLT